MSMSDHIKQQVAYENFLPEKSRSYGIRQNWILLFYKSGRSSKRYRKYVTYFESRQRGRGELLDFYNGGINFKLFSQAPQ